MNRAIPTDRHALRKHLSKSGGLLITAAILLPLVLLVIAAAIDYRNVRTQVQREAEANRDVLHQHALSIFLTHEVIARSIMNRIRDMSWDDVQRSADIHDYLAEMAKQFPQVHSIWVDDASGMARASSMFYPVPNLSAADREFYKLLKETGAKVVVSRPFTANYGAAREVFNISFRIDNPDGSFGGFIGTAVATDYFRQIFTTLNQASDEDSSMSLFREDGAVLVRIPEVKGAATASYGSVPDVAAMLKANTEGMVQRNSALDGKWRSYAFAKIEGFPVFIGRGISQETIQARWRRNLISYLAFFASSVAVLLALGYFAWRQHSLLLATNANLEALVRDRTQHLNRALAEKTAYFREVHHRVKNNLQIISSLARLQERHGESSDTLERRIQAMALVHELLYARAEATDLDVADYVIRLCSALEGASGYRNTCHVTAEKAPIDLERAVPFALILSEAVSNAYKHARPSGDRLRIDVHFRREGGDYVLTVSDNGAEAVATKSGKRGFGNKLVTALAQQLWGEVQLGSGAGAAFSLRFPAERSAHEPGLPG